MHSYLQKQSIKRREMETYKIKTLQKMLEQELLNLERLKGDTNNSGYKTSEANIKTLREQLRSAGAEVSKNPKAMANCWQTLPIILYLIPFFVRVYTMAIARSNVFG